MNNVELSDKLNSGKGIIEFIVKDKNGNIINIHKENLIKINAKSMLSHRLPSTEIWDRNANTNSGGWVDRNVDPNEEYAPRYMILGASYDPDTLVPLDENDDRFYVVDIVTGRSEPIRLTPGAEYDGGLINAIPLAEPDRPLLRIENIDYEATYQPSGTPLMQDDVRALNNIILFESTITQDEYNGFGITNSDFFTITEVALVGGKKLDSIGTCEYTPKQLMFETSSSGDPLLVNFNGSDVISIDSSESEVDLIKKGDQIKLISSDSSLESQDELDQVNPYYLVMSKQEGGRDIQLDRVPVNSDGDLLASGTYGIFRDTLKIFSHVILSNPVKKSVDFSITIRWRIIFS